MYSRQSGHRERGISIPQNYSGNAFSEISNDNSDFEASAIDPPTENISEDAAADAVHSSKEQKNFLPINIGSEELIIIGIVLLLFQSEEGSGMIPLLLAILFLG